MLYRGNDSRRHFFYPDGNLQLLQYSFTKGIPLRQFNPAFCGIFAWSGLVNGRKIPYNRKCFLPDFFTGCYSGANGLILKGQLINSLQVIIRRCGSKGQGKSRQGEQFAFILYFRDKDEGYFFRCFQGYPVPLKLCFLNPADSPFFHRRWLGLQFQRQM